VGFTEAQGSGCFWNRKIQEEHPGDGVPSPDQLEKSPRKIKAMLDSPE
jgi:hypothetical protein